MRKTFLHTCVLSLIAIISFSFTRNESPVAISQSKALLTADIIFEGQIIKIENNEATIKIITPIWNDIRKNNIFKQSEIVLPFDYKTHYSLRGQIPNINEKAIFAFKIDTKTKKLKHFFYNWYITRMENGATQYYIAGKYSKTERNYVSSEEVINGIKILRNSFLKNVELFQEVIPIKPKVSLADIKKAKVKNTVAKILIEDVEAYNAKINE